MSVLGSPVEKLSFKKNGTLRFYDGDETAYVGVKSHPTITGSVDYVLPPAPPSVSGYVLSCDTSGNLSWVEQTGGGGGGEANTASNAGSGAGVFKTKSGVDLAFRSLVAGNDSGGQRTCIVTQGTNEITVTPIGLAPVGTIMAWLKSHGGNPYATLPDGWVECDGRTIPSAYGGPFAGRTIPNLINYPADASHAAGTNQYLRGDLTSGQSVYSATEHAHVVNSGSICAGTSSDKAIRYDTFSMENATHLPPSYNVVWILRIK